MGYGDYWILTTVAPSVQVARLGDGKIVPHASRNVDNRVILGLGIFVRREFGDHLILLRNRGEAYLQGSLTHI